MAVRLRLPGGRRVRPAPAMLMAVALLAAGCSEQSSAERLIADAPVLIEHSQMFVMVQNRAGLALVDVSIAIVTSGQAEYSTEMARMENMEKRQIPLGDFHTRGGAVFNLALVRPKSLRFQARDTTGKNYEVEVPWS